MSIKFKLVVAVAAIALSTTHASAQWMHESEEDAFSGVALNIAVGSGGGGYALGFRCSSDEALSIIYMTPEAIDQDTVANINTAAPTLMIRVDDHPVVELAGFATSTIDGELMLTNDDVEVLEIAKQARDAQERIAVTVEMLGERYHTTNISTQRSTASLQSLIDGCELEGDKEP